MPTPTHFISAEEIRRIAGAASSKRLPDEDGETFPIPLRTDGGLVILVMYLRAFGPPDNRFIEPPHYAMYIDGETGKVLRFWAVKPEDLGIRAPKGPIADPGIPGTTADIFMRARDRFLALSPDIWKAYAAGSTKVAPAVAAAAREYLDAFRQITSKDVASFYVAASPHYFNWLHAVAAP